MKLLKRLGILLVLLVLLGVGCFKAMSKKMPESVNGENASVVADKMWESLNKEAWDTLSYLQWEFMGGHKYKWDKKNNLANIQWGDNEVIMDLDAYEGKALKGGVVQEGDKKDKLISKAWSFWCNDSFWMFAPFKIKDPGTALDVVSLENGQTGLKVSYESGGVTPGDVYVWHLDENYRPTAYQMWVKILPVKGLEVSWGDWKDIGGAQLATAHKSSMMSFAMKDVKGGHSIDDIDATAQSFNLQ